MDNNLALSIVIYNVDSENCEKALHEAFKSITSDRKVFERNVEILLFNAAHWFETSPYSAYGNIASFTADDECSAYKYGLSKAKGKFVCFMKSNAYFSREFLDFVDRSFNSSWIDHYNIVNVACQYINPKNGFADYGKINLTFQKGKLVLSEHMDAINLNLNSYFIRKDTLPADFFDNNITEESTAIRLIELLLRNKEYYFDGTVTLFFASAPETDSYNYSAQFTKDWYFKCIDEEWLPLLKKYPDNMYLQNVIFYLLEVRFSCNWNDRNKNIISGDEIEAFLSKAKEVLQHIDNKIISAYDVNSKNILPKFMEYIFLRLKYQDKDYQTQIVYNMISFIGIYNDELIDMGNTVKASIWAVNYENDKLIIDGRMTNLYYVPEDEIEVYFQFNNKTIKATKNKVYALNKFFNISVNHDLTFIGEIDTKDFIDINNIGIIFKYKEFTYKVPIQFSKIQSRLSNGVQRSFWRFGDYVMTYDKFTKNIVIRHMNLRRKIGCEARLALNIIQNIFSDPVAIKVLPFRLLFHMSKPFYRRKNIWITFDQLFKGGDNGEYFFRYVNDRKDKRKIKMYYVLNKTAPEYKSLHKKYGRKVLKFNSIRHKIVSLHADMIFATRVDVKLYCGFAAQLEKYFRGDFNGRIFCLQHGLTIQRIAQYQNRLFDNTRLYFCVSPYEKKNLSHPVYDYDEDMLLMTGAPRYDGLVPVDKKQILISPTWRRSVTAGTNDKGSMNEYSVNFKHTEYFRIYNSLINDEKLIDCAKRTGYKLIYLIHPILSPQISDFDTNEFVTIIPGSEVNYEKILSESSLMLTDYSGVQFDFAYQRKPLVYYHPDKLPPQYEAGGLEYDTMGFGPVCKNHEQIVNALCEYMENGCKMTDMYVNRVNEFFAFSDRNNCQRVYEATLKYMDQHGIKY